MTVFKIGHKIFIKLKILKFNDCEIYCHHSINILLGIQLWVLERIRSFCYQKGLCCCVKYLHNKEQPKNSPAPIIVSISIYLKLQKISISSEIFIEYVERNILIYFLYSKAYSTSTK